MAAAIKRRRLRTPQARGARTKIVQAGVSIERQPEDLRRAIKRECWTRRITIAELADGIHLTADHVQRMLCHGPSQKKIEARVLNRIVAALHITPRVAARLHLLGAREAGWQVS